MLQSPVGEAGTDKSEICFRKVRVYKSKGYIIVDL